MKTKIFLFLTLLSFTVFTSCDKKEDECSDDFSTYTIDNQSSYSIRVYVDGDLEISSIGAGQSSTIILTSGTYEIQIQLTSAPQYTRTYNRSVVPCADETITYSNAELPACFVSGTAIIYIDNGTGNSYQLYIDNVYKADIGSYGANTQTVDGLSIFHTVKATQIGGSDIYTEDVYVNVCGNHSAYIN